MTKDIYKWTISAALGLTCLLIVCKVYIYSQNEHQSYNNILQPVATLQHEAAPQMLNGAIMQLPPSNTNVLIYRQDNNNYQANYNTEFGVTSLLANFSIGNNYNLSLKHAKGYGQRSKDTAQDPRLFSAGEQFFMIYNEKNENNDIREMHLATLQLNHDELKTISITRLEHELAANTPQKNWVPFDYNGAIYFIYSFDPYIVLHFDQHTAQLTKVATSNTHIQQQWPFGIIRGGTPAIYIPELQAYLGFFHSSVELKAGEGNWSTRKTPRWRKYFMGAVLFENKPPFNLLAFTPKPLAFKDLYKDMRQKYKIIFPAGFIMQDNKFIISAGIDDAKTMLLSVDKQDLLKAMHPLG